MEPREILARSGLLVLLAGTGLAQGGPPPLAGSFPNVAVPPGNPITPEKTLLGMALFFEEQLSSDDTVACATCHLPEAGGGDPRSGARHPGLDGLMRTPDDEFGSPGMVPQDSLGLFVESPSFGVGLQATARNSPSMINAAFFNTQFWDRRAGPVFRDLAGNVVLPDLASLETQAVEPPVSSVEMAHAQRTWDQITAKLAGARPLALASDLPPRLATFLGTHATYGPLFQLAFGTPAITRERIAMALATYQRTLVSDQTPFHLGTLTPTQLLGLDAFHNRAQCATCHPSANGLFSDGLPKTIFLPDHPRQVKTPSLLNVGLRPRFMSSGQINRINLVLQHYQQRGMFQPLTGDVGAMRDLLENGLTDPRVANRLEPFDRPTLRSERTPPGSNLFGTGRAGSGGIVPTMLADTPPFLGNPTFQLGLGDALGGTQAGLLIARRTAAPGTLFLGVPVAIEASTAAATIVPVSPGGPGAGTATVRMPVPPDAALVGVRFYAQWLVRDPGVRPRIAVTRAAELELF